jgi:hypothetical protein
MAAVGAEVLALAGLTDPAPLVFIFNLALYPVGAVVLVLRLLRFMDRVRRWLRC